MKKTKIVIVGDGIAAWSILFFLKKECFERGNLDNYEITQVANADFAPACTDSSTAINSLRGTTKGLSPLGDLVVDSYDLFKELYLEYKFVGVEEGSERQIWPKTSPNHNKWIKRYPEFKEAQNHFYEDSEAFILDPKALGADLKARFFKHEEIKAYVTKIEEKKLITTMGEISFDKLILCTSNFTTHFNLSDDKTLTHAKPVAGSFLEFDCDLNSKAFSYALEGHHLIYRATSKKLLIGSTTTNQSDSYIPDTGELQKIYDEVKGFFKDIYPIPPFNEGKKRTGIRQKGYKRLPFWGNVQEDIFAIHSLYKNGFTFAFLGAKTLVAQIIS